MGACAGGMEVALRGPELSTTSGGGWQLGAGGFRAGIRWTIGLPWGRWPCVLC